MFWRFCTLMKNWISQIGNVISVWDDWSDIYLPMLGGWWEEELVLVGVWVLELASPLRERERERVKQTDLERHQIIGNKQRMTVNMSWGEVRVWIRAGRWSQCLNHVSYLTQLCALFSEGWIHRQMDVWLKLCYIYLRCWIPDVEAPGLCLITSTEY